MGLRTSSRASESMVPLPSETKRSKRQSDSQCGRSARQVAPRGVERAEVMAHAFHDLQHDVRRALARGGVQCRDSHEGFQAVARAAQEALVQQLSFALRHRCKALVVIAVGQGPGKAEMPLGAMSLSSATADRLVSSLFRELADRATAGQHRDADDQQQPQRRRGPSAVLARPAQPRAPFRGQPPCGREHGRQQQAGAQRDSPATRCPGRPRCLRRSGRTRRRRSNGQRWRSRKR